MTRRRLLALIAAGAAPPPAKLAVVGPALLDREDGATLPAGYEYMPGELMYLSFRISGFVAQKDKVDVRYQIVLTDPEGILVTPPVTGAVRVELTENDKNWLPKASLIIPLPPQLPSGTFQIKIHAADEFGKTSTEETLPFRVRGINIAPNEVLEIRNVRFFRGEQDRTPLDPPVYLQGDELWGRFEMTGFKLGDKNAFNVEYGLAVYRPSGKLLYEEPKAAAESDAPFYPKRLMRGVLNLTLSKDLSPGTYALLITAKDNVGGKTAEAKTTFEVKAR